jgi:hypothetical protein
MRKTLSYFAGALVLLSVIAAGLAAPDATVVIETPMTPPRWALLEHELLRANSEAVEFFADRYIDERGYLLHTPRWGTLDGPDDAIETYFNWTLLHALGGSDSALELYKKGLEGHLKQYGELRTTLTPLAKNGAYRGEFITKSDWFHTGEGMRAFLLQGLSEPTSDILRTRTKRFAGLYMNEDPSAPNYDPVNKVIKSIWNGSLGPMMRKATVYDWVGDPVPGRFHLLHHPNPMAQMYDLEERYDKMLAHCTEYLDSVGDNSLNLAATILHLNAYMLTHEEKYRDWVLEYVNAWKERTALTGGNIPSNVGLDGKPGGEYNGQWWKGTYGWNFTIFDGEIEQIAHRNYFTSGSWPGFSNAFLLTGDQSYIDVLRRQMDNIYAHKKVVDGKEMIPQMYGDPRGYKHSGDPEWYHWTQRMHTDRLTEIYLWSMNRKDLERVPKTGWVGFIEGQNPGHPEEALARDLEFVRERVAAVRSDSTTADTRLADYLLRFTPAATDALTNLMLGGYFTGRIWVLHSRVRYFDPVKRRSGIPEDVGALVEKLTGDSVTLTLVNMNQVEPRTVLVQAGGYAEHQFNSATVNGKTTPIDNAYVTVRLAPGAGARVEFQMKRYANQPTFAQPWDRGWMVKR